jgi:hypothetical protein
MKRRRTKNGPATPAPAYGDGGRGRRWKYGSHGQDIRGRRTEGPTSHGTPPEDMSHEELQQAMQQQHIQPQPVTQEDQQAMASAEDADPQSGAES